MSTTVHVGWSHNVSRIGIARTNVTKTWPSGPWRKHKRNDNLQRDSPIQRTPLANGYMTSVHLFEDAPKNRSEQFSTIYNETHRESWEEAGRPLTVIGHEFQSDKITRSYRYKSPADPDPYLYIRQQHVIRW